MSIYYSQSNKPRLFDYMNKPIPMSIEHVRNNSRRSEYTNRSSFKTLNEYMNNGPQNPPSTSRSRISYTMPDTKRTVVPEMNKENNRPQSIKTIRVHDSYTPGNMQTLIQKTSNINEKYDNMRRINSAKALVRQSSSSDLNIKRVLKPCPLKADYDYYTQITTLPISKCVKENNHSTENTARTKNTESARNKLIYDMHSSIEGLPGTLRSRTESPNLLNEPRGISMMKRGALTSEQMKDNRNIGLKSTVRPSTRAESSCFNDYNFPSNSVLEGVNKTSTMNNSRVDSRPPSTMNSGIKPNQMKQKFLASSYDENNGPSVNLNKQPKFKDLFKSNFEIN